MNYGRELGEELFDVIAKFADYAFNKSHSYGYGLVTYQTAYLKAHYGAEYMAALLTSTKKDKDRTAIYLNGFKDKKVVMLVTCDSFYAEKYQDKMKKLVEASGGEVSAFYQIHALEEKGKEKTERGKEKMIEDVIKLAPEIKSIFVAKQQN